MAQYLILDLSLIISIIKHSIAIFIDTSATLKIGKLIGTSSRKSKTYPLNNLSIPFPTVPPKRYAIPIKFQKDFGGDFKIIVINNNEVITLIIERKLVELLKRLNAAPLFFTRVKFNNLGIIFVDLS
tara:strand:+ start:598 stop:978 length:381 start_codon:yes stop_codon:yes gene_type:complete